VRLMQSDDWNVVSRVSIESPDPEVHEHVSSMDLMCFGRSKF